MKKFVLSLIFILVFASMFVIVSSAYEDIVITHDKNEQIENVFTNKDGSVGKYYTPQNITYLSTSGEMKEGSIYYFWNLYRGNGFDYVGIYAVYLPHDFDYSQMIYFADRVDFYDTNGELVTNRYFNAFMNDLGIYSYETFDGEPKNTQDVKNQIQKISIPNNIVIFGSNTFGGGDNANGGATSLHTLTYNGKEAIEKTAIFKKDVEFWSLSFGSYYQKAVWAVERIIFEGGNVKFQNGYAFYRSRVLKEIVFLEGTYDLGGSPAAFGYYFTGASGVRGEGASGEGTLERIVLQTGVVFNNAHGDNFQNNVLGKYDIVFIGSDNGEIPTNHDEIKSNIAYTRTTFSGNVIYDSICYVWGHHYGDVCKITYDNGFANEGEELSKCAICQRLGKVGVAPAIFEALGYSVDFDGDAIVGGYRIKDFKLLDRYEDINETTLTYGVIFVNVDSTNTLTFDKEGKITNEKAVQAESIDRNYAEFKFKVNGFKKDESNYEKLKAVKLVISMYVLDGKNISFVQSESAYDDKVVTSGESKLKVITLGALMQKVSETDKSFGE